ncbi:MAG: AAA family ATPase [Bacteroidia bacterium]|nr:AAA family ATPase [Bacteroidia bacterium]
MYDFYNREKESRQLREGFESIAKIRKGSGFYLTGKKHAGKTRLVQEFLKNVLADPSIKIDLPDFVQKPDQYIIQHTCKEEEQQPYTVFSSIREKISEEKNIYEIVYDVGSVILAVLQVSEIINQVNKLFSRIFGAKRNTADDKTYKEYLTYRKFLRKSCKKAPLIIFIQNAQWIDEPSLIMIRKLLLDSSTFWGLIILERDSNVGDGLVDSNRFSVQHLIREGLAEKIYAGPFPISFPLEFLRINLRNLAFSKEESDLLYHRCEGLPGKLIEFITYCIDNHLIYKENDYWIKSSDFLDNIKTHTDRFFDDILALCNPGAPCFPDQAGLIRLSRKYKMDLSDVDSIASLTYDLICSGMRISRELGQGVFLGKCYIVYDQSGERYVAERLILNDFAPDSSNMGSAVPGMESRSALADLPIEQEMIIKGEKGQILLRKFYDGEVEYEDMTDRITNRFINICKAVKSLHDRGIVHGMIKPQTIIDTSESGIRLFHFQKQTVVHLYQTMISQSQMDQLQFVAPECLENPEAISLSADIYSLGVLYFLSMTNRLPFTARTQAELMDRIRRKEIRFTGDFLQKTPTDEVKRVISKSLSFNPESRYLSIDEMIGALTDILSGPSLGMVLEEENLLKLSQRVGNEKTAQMISLIRASNQIAREDVLTHFIKLANNNFKLIKKTFNRKDQKLFSEIFNIESFIQNRINTVRWFAIILSFVLLATVFFIRRPKKYDYINNTIAIEMIENGSASKDQISGGTLTELVTYAIQQRAGLLDVNTLANFKKQNPKKRDAPDLLIQLNLDNKQNRQNLTVKTSHGSRKRLSETYTFQDPNAFLSNDITNFTDLIRKSIEQDNTSKTTWKPYSGTLYYDAYKEYLKGKDYWSRLEAKQAKSSFDDAKDIDSKFTAAKLGLIEVYQFNLDFDNATTLIEDVKSDFSSLSYLDSIRCFALDASIHSDYQTANKFFSKINSKEDISMQFLIGQFYFEIRDIGKSISIFSSCLEINPKYNLAINRLAYCYSHLGKHEDAIKLFNEYVTIDHTANSYDSQGDGYIAAGKYPEALESKQKAVDLGDDPYYHNSMAFILLNLGKIKEAAKQTNFYIDKSKEDGQKANIAEGLFTLGFGQYLLKNDPAAILECRSGLEFDDSLLLKSSNYKLHWLYESLMAKNGDTRYIDEEVRHNNALIAEYKITPYYYNEILKFNYLLQLAQAVGKKDQKAVDEILVKLDKIGNKLKDWYSPYDKAFINTEAAKILEKSGNNDLVVARLDTALVYNGNYPFANYMMYQRHLKAGNSAKAAEIRQKLELLWKDADVEFKAVYKFGNQI